MMDWMLSAMVRILMVVLIIWCVAVACLILSSKGHGQQFVPIGPHPVYAVMFSWDKVVDTTPQVIGYKVHWGTESGSYTHTLDVGNVCKVIINGFIDGQHYYAAITSYASGGSESDYSTELEVYSKLSEEVWVALQESDNLKDWKTIRYYGTKDTGRNFFRLKIEYPGKPAEVEQTILRVFNTDPIPEPQTWQQALSGVLGTLDP